MKIYPIVLIGILLFQVGSRTYAQELSGQSQQEVTKIIRIFQSGNRDSIASVVTFPLKRNYPIPAIDDQDELKNRFDEVFDSCLIEKIARSEPDHWSSGGWRGIMFERGLIWIAEGEIIAVNYQSEKEREWEKQLIQAEKSQLYPPLKDFQKPVYELTTPHYLIRIDELQEGLYRYASWKRGKSESEKPDLVLESRKMEFAGSGGNHWFEFKSGVYSYRIDRNIIGTSETPDFNLEVRKGDQLLLREDGKLTK